MSRNDSILDVRSFDCGIPEVRKYLPPLEIKRDETPRAQKRLLRLWMATRKELHQRIYADPETISRWQLERVSLLVNNMFATNRFYHELYSAVGFRAGDIITWDDYHALPTINKNDIIENFDLFTAANTLTADEYHVSRTSGSSGKIVTRYQDEAYVDYKNSLYLRYWEQLIGRERRPDEWLYEIYFQHPPFTSADGYFPTFTLSLDCPPEIAIRHLQAMQPAVLTTFPSYLFRMGRFDVDLAASGVSAIVTNSEGSTSAERAAIADRLGVPVFDEYSSEEMSFVAGQCRDFYYHLIEDNVRLDIINEDENGLGEVVVTGFMNTFMPFIRYRQGDLAQLDSDRGACSCGSRFRRLSKLLGRADQSLQKRTGEFITPDRIMSLYDRVLIPRNAQVGEFHILQEDLDVIKVFVKVPSETASSVGAVDTFVNGLRDLFNDPKLRIEVHMVDEMPATLSRKRRLITSTLTNPPVTDISR